jgi:hypothetical protein
MPAKLTLDTRVTTEWFRTRVGEFESYLKYDIARQLAGKIVERHGITKQLPSDLMARLQHTTTFRSEVIVMSVAEWQEYVADLENYLVTELMKDILFDLRKKAKAKLSSKLATVQKNLDELVGMTTSLVDESATTK